MVSESFVITVNPFADSCDVQGSSGDASNNNCPNDQNNVTSDNMPTLYGGSILRFYSYDIIRDPLLGGSATTDLVINYNNNSSVLTSSHNIASLHSFRILSLDTNSGDLILPEIGSEILANSNVRSGSNTKSNSMLIKIENENISPRTNQIKINDQVLDVIDFGGYKTLLDGPQIQVSAKSGQGTGQITHINATVNLSLVTGGSYTLTHQGVENYQ